MELAEERSTSTQEVEQFTSHDSDLVSFLLKMANDLLNHNQLLRLPRSCFGASASHAEDIDASLPVPSRAPRVVMSRRLSIAGGASRSAAAARLSNIAPPTELQKPRRSGLPGNVYISFSDIVLFHTCSRTIL